MLNRKFDEVLDKRDDLKEQIDKIDDKMNKFMEIMINLQHKAISNGDTSVATNSPVKIDVKPLKEQTILSPRGIDQLTLTSVETTNNVDATKKLNEKSRTLHYPKSSVSRTHVPDNKVSWNVSWPEYEPVKYTSEKVLSNPNADNNLLA